MSDRTTIFALSSGPPPAAIAIIRISGPAARTVLDTLTRRSPPKPREAIVRTLYDPLSAAVLDQALVVFFPSPASVTGDDLVELHIHGGRAVIAAVLATLARMPDLAAAAPGAFTRRAFDNGKLDLAQVEGLADLLAAETEGQRRAALAMVEGVLGKKAENWRRAILSLAAQAEAALDFTDEGDVEGSLDRTGLADLVADVQTWLAAPSAERLHNGLHVVLAGPPNAGKSTLLNALVGRNAAIISPIAGTTRDIIEVPVILDGLPLIFIDTAGLHEKSNDPIEQAGIGRAHAALASADLILWLGHKSECPPGNHILRIAAKCDLVSANAYGDSLSVSALTGTGLDILRTRILDKARSLLPLADQIPINARQRDLLAHFSAELSAAFAADDPLIYAEHLRTACRALDMLVGRLGVEDMLDALFSGFCIGK